MILPVHSIVIFGVPVTAAPLATSLAASAVVMPVPDVTTAAAALARTAATVIAMIPVMVIAMVIAPVVPVLALESVKAVQVALAPVQGNAKAVQAVRGPALILVRAALAIAPAAVRGALVHARDRVRAVPGHVPEAAPVARVTALAIAIMDVPRPAWRKYTPLWEKTLC